MKNKNNKKSGFTLIELIVSVTIIALLTVVAMVSYTGTNRKARDSRRMADVEKIRMALELYRQGMGSTYPSTLTSLTTNNPPYLQAIPVGPKSDTYTYNKTGGYTYTLQATVEDAGSSNLPNGIYQVTNP
jgi:prepilin-type N-terminal cleavage/methylation domain-containing protein